MDMRMFDCLPLQEGDSLDHVIALHRRLLAEGQDVDQVELDAQFFGPSTKAAVAAFQRVQGLDPSGIVDVQTDRAFALLANKGSLEAKAKRRADAEAALGDLESRAVGAESDAGVAHRAALPVEEEANRAAADADRARIVADLARITAGADVATADRIAGEKVAAAAELAVRAAMARAASDDAHNAALAARKAALEARSALPSR